MRLDRSLTLRFFDPLHRAASLFSDQAVPILMYHSISSESEAETVPYYQTYTHPTVFRKHIELLAGNGYRTISLPQAVELLAVNAPLPGKYVVITFDDGFRNFYTEAFPVLRDHGFIATVFLPTSYICTPRGSFKGQECLTWAEVLQLRSAGMSFGSHTVTHPKLPELGWADIERELRDSKTQLEQRLQEPVWTFAHPFAFPQANQDYVQRLRKLLINCGYSCGVTTAIGRVKPMEDALFLKRIPVNSSDDPELFQAKLCGAYDWVAFVQKRVKRLKQVGRKLRQRGLNSPPSLRPAPTESRSA